MSVNPSQPLSSAESVYRIGGLALSLASRESMKRSDIPCRSEAFSVNRTRCATELMTLPSYNCSAILLLIEIRNNSLISACTSVRNML